MANILQKIPREIKRSMRRLSRTSTESVVQTSSQTPNFENKSYGTIYYPYYNPIVEISPEKAEIYNKDGQKMDTFFVRDIHGAHCPNFHSSKYFLWDRYNIGLDTHFYSHNSMLETMGKPTRKYGYLHEAPSIVPQDYLIFEKHKGLEKDFDIIFTYEKSILDSVANAKFFPLCAVPWYGRELGCDIVLDDTVYTKKNKTISMMCSEKQDTEHHRIRHAFASKAQTLGVDIFGRFNGGTYLKHKADSLEEYFYQITIENGATPYYFTEKLLDCFLSMTIPIYLGASEIHKFFNPDGIIMIKENDVDKLDKILQQCTEKEYIERLPAIIENYTKALKYLNINDLWYESYFCNTSQNIFENIQ